MWGRGGDREGAGIFVVPLGGRCQICNMKIVEGLLLLFLYGALGREISNLHRENF